MRTPQIKKANASASGVTYTIVKRNFDLKNVEVNIPGNEIRVHPTVTATKRDWLSKEDMLPGATVKIEDNAGLTWYIDIPPLII